MTNLGRTAAMDGGCRTNHSEIRFISVPWTSRWVRGAIRATDGTTLLSRLFICWRFPPLAVPAELGALRDSLDEHRQSLLREPLAAPLRAKE